jgi:hypothetical protein
MGDLGASLAKRLGRAGGERTTPGADELVHRLLGDDARATRRTAAQVRGDREPIGVGQLPVDERRHEVIDGLAVKH